MALGIGGGFVVTDLVQKHVGETDSNRAIELMKAGAFSQAIPFLTRAIEEDPEHYGNWYMLGQCFRFTNNLPNAISHLVKAAELDPDEKAVFLALGIAHQLAEQFNEAIDAFRRALEIDSNYDLALNSLALTQMKLGQFELAVHNYDEALRALTRNLVLGFQNSRGRGIVKQHDSHHVLWLQYAVFGGIYLASIEGDIERIVWPTGDMAMREERDEDFEGLYWIDNVESNGEKVRLFLPNYFNTFRENLAHNISYTNFMRGKGSALRELGRIDEADEHVAEGEYFRPRSFDV